MNEGIIRPVLVGQKALVVGVANHQSIAYGCAKAFRMMGAEVRPYVAPATAVDFGPDLDDVHFMFYPSRRLP